MTNLIVPLLIVSVCFWGLYKRVDIFSAMVKGAKEGLSTAAGIIPALTVLLTAVYMLRSSGALEALSKLFSPLLSAIGIPADCAALMLLRPISGSGALAIGTEIMEKAGVDSFAGRCAAVMLGSTETSFYVIAIYFAAAEIKKTRQAVPVALLADLVGFIVAAISVRLIFF